MILRCCAALAIASCATTPEPKKASAPFTVETIKGEARDASAWVTSDLARDFLATAAELPAIAPRVAYVTQDKTKAYTQAQADALPADEQKLLARRVLDEEYYYTTKYGTPVSYARALDVLAAHGVTTLDGKQVLDFGYGYIGHLRMFALTGAAAVGIEVDPLLPVLYSAPGDTGPVSAKSGKQGTVRLVDGRFPADPKVVEATGGGYDLFVSKNVLKIGFVHPSQPVDPKFTLQLGVDDAAFIKAVWDLLKPGGKALVYNIFPTPSKPGEKFIPWAEGKSPFAKALWEQQGFTVAAFDQDDTAKIRELAHVLKWDVGEDAMALDTLWAVYTLVEKP